MIKEIFEYILTFLKSRLLPMILVFVVLFIIIINRLFSLQIINGETYVGKLSESIEKTTSVNATRGRIYDKNGVLLAYNDLAFSIKISDSGTYKATENKKATEVKNATINSTINKTMEIIENNGDTIINDLPIIINDNGEFEFSEAAGSTSLLRFLRDTYGQKSVNDLTEEQKNSTAQQVVDYMCSKYEVSPDFSDKNRLMIINLRRYMLANSYNRYMSFTIAYEVSDETVAAILENSDSLVGVVVEEEYIRRYVDSVYTSQILGYTGNVSVSELDELKAQNSQYEANDVVGKAGIEQSLELELQGDKGSKKVYVDKVGRITEVLDQTDPKTGHDVYLTIDIELQKKIYHAIEDELVQILTSKIVNSDTTITYERDGTTVADIFIPVKNVYFALIDNNIISTSELAKEKTAVEQEVYATFLNKKDSVLPSVRSELTDASTAFGKLSSEMQSYMTYIYDMLKSNSVINTSNIDTNDATYKKWRAESISLQEMLTYAITQNWIDMSKITNAQYSSLQEAYSALVEYIINTISEDSGFAKKMYYQLINSGSISGRQVCLILYEQGVLNKEDADYNALNNGSQNSYNFIMNKITLKEITPAQLALEPCSGSAVVTDPNNGEVMALVSYPSYDNNRLSGTVDAAYYNQLRSDKSLPLLNRATTSQMMPGSIYKSCAAIAGLEEGVISLGENIYCSGQFTTVTPSPKCWIHPGAHGNESVSTAIRDSCNVFFYNVGYRLAMEPGGKYNSMKGTAAFQKYAEALGLATKSGIEIFEAEPQASNTDAIASAIGQGTHNYSALNLARYTSTLANSGTCYNLTLVKKITDYDGNIIKENEPVVANEMSDVKESTWNAVRSGMKMVIDNTAAFKKLPFAAAGKSGTAQDNLKKADHITFISYAPYDNPEVAVSVLVPYGYESTNSAELTVDIYKILYGIE